MRWGVLLSIALTTGCAARQQRPPADTGFTYAETAAPVLAFRPPVAIGEVELELPREGRQPVAFGGYQETSISYSYTRLDDRQTFDVGGRFQRRAIVERFGIVHR